MDSQSERKLAENELIFKKHNERIKRGVEKLVAQSKVDDLTLNLFCECSNEKCQKMVAVSTSDYDRVHRNNRYFIVLRGHENMQVEKVIEKNSHFSVVEKLITPPATTGMQLNPT
ncbi:MAG TPA: hypothetical protein VF272_04360 [Candidatus Saccharimonadia bacterium]